MTEDEKNPETPTPTPTDGRTAGERIAKMMARAGVASRREAERMILEGRVAVNGTTITSPALDITPDDRVTIDGQPMDAPQETRLWLYYKPAGLVTSAADEKGRQTVFDALPRDMPRVMSIGRLDLNSEGLLLLTNDGELKRRLELPTTGWLRRYRVRVNGRPTDLTFDPLRRGATIEGEEFAPMEIKLDSQQGANAWLTVGIREGRNREIRRAMAHVGLAVNRLIRIGYGPFRLTGLEENELREIKRKMLRDQLGGLLTGEIEETPREFRSHGARDGGRREDGGGRAGRDGAGRPFQKRGDDERRPFAPRGDRSGGFGRKGEESGRKPFGARPFERRDDAGRSEGGRSDGGSSDRGRKPFGARDDRGGKPQMRREGWGGKPRDDRGAEGRTPQKPHHDRDAGDREGGPQKSPHKPSRKPFGSRMDGSKPAPRWKAGGGKPGGKPAGEAGGKAGHAGPRNSFAGGPARSGDKPAGGRMGAGKTRRAPGKGARPEGGGRGPRKPRG